MLTCLLHAPVRRGIILEDAAYLTSSLQAEGIRVVLQTGQVPYWPAEIPIPDCVVDDQLNPLEGLRFRSPRWAASRFTLAFRNSYRRWILARKIKADVVHIQLLLPWVDWGFIQLHRRSSKVICTVHDVIPHVAKLPPTIDRFLRRRCYQAADGLIFHSAANLRQFEAIYSFLPRHAAIIPHGLEWRTRPNEAEMARSKQQLGVPENRSIILMFGELRPNKGLDVLIQAFQRVLLGVPDAFLLIAGSVHAAVSKEELLLQLQTLPPGSWLWHQGWVDDVTMREYFTAASIAVLPYTAFASQSGVLAQAYAHSCPLVVSDVGSLGATVQQDGSGLVVPPADAVALAAALTRLLTEPAFRAACQENIVRVARTEYSWRSVAQRTVEFYQTLCSSRP